ncbi:hypothetical protein PR002_g13354 [Phytophthora rubi]|uniref:Uncharacterized protein n=1 Tax=Phytophthora rubi TaxID=129364 RepID=A0A6A3LHZ1_9STRA|nr:hypothetical protein PR002_g13354 [Phytophthora rubi]
MAHGVGALGRVSAGARLSLHANVPTTASRGCAMQAIVAMNNIRLWYSR